MKDKHYKSIAKNKLSHTVEMCNDYKTHFSNPYILQPLKFQTLTIWPKHKSYFENQRSTTSGCNDLRSQKSGFSIIKFCKGDMIMHSI